MKLLKIVPDHTNIDFVRLRGWAFGLTLALSILAIALVGLRGLNMGVDFTGGLMIEEKFASAPSVEAVRQTVDRLGVGEATIQQVGSPTTLSIRLPIQTGADEGATNGVVRKIEAALAQRFPGATFSRYSTVGGRVSDELKWKGGMAVFFAVLGIGLNIVAAFLTIIGYSINDKIVIDDRIRENMRRYRKMDMREIINLSVNETLPRTVMTSVTILLALAALLVLGGHVLRGFTAAMFLGIVVGTYSSIYVSSSLLISLGLRAEPNRAKPGTLDKQRLSDAERIAPRER